MYLQESQGRNGSGPDGVSDAGVADELLRWSFAPLRAQRFFRLDQVRAVGEIEPVAVSPVLMHPAVRIGPVVVDLAAEHVTANPPHVLILPSRFQIIVTHADVINIRHLER